MSSVIGQVKVNRFVLAEEVTRLILLYLLIRQDYIAVTVRIS